MQGGFTALHAGLLRPKNIVNLAATKLVDTATATLTYWVLGFALMFGVTIGGWMGHSGFFFGSSTAAPESLAQFGLHALLCAVATTIVSGAVAERMSFRAYVALAAFVAGIIYPLFGHWVWAHAGMRPAGWLARGGFVDFAGGTVVQSVAGWAALAALLCVGNRSGRYARSGKPLALGRTSVPLATLGLFAVWIAWLAAIGGAAAGEPSLVPRVVLVALLGSAASGAAAIAVATARARRASLDTAIRGVLAGLAAVSAGANALDPAPALVVGASAGLIMLAVEEILVRLRIDDAVGAVPAHLGGGAWGTLALALLGDPDRLGTGLHPLAQLAAQVEGIAVCAAWAFGVTFLFCKGLGLITRLHVASDEEFIGLNVSEHETGTELMDLMDALDVTAMHETPFVYGEPFAEVAQVTFAPDGTVRKVNPAACAIFGYDESEFTRVTVDKLVADPTELEALSAEEDAPPLELRGLRRTGEDFPMEVALAAGESGEPDTLAIKDITERKESEESLTRAQDAIHRRLERELEETTVVPGAIAAADVELPGADVSLALPARRDGHDWFGWYHDPSAKALTIYAGELIEHTRGGAAALLSSVLAPSGYEPQYTHGLLLGDARYAADRQLRNLAEVLGRIVAQEGRGEMTMTMSFAQIDLATGALTFVNAGRRTPALWKAGRTVKELGGGGTPLGEPESLELHVEQGTLASGDLLLFVGDGMVDTVSPDGSVLRLSELKKVLAGRAAAQEVCDEVVARARGVWKDQPADSHAVLAVKWAPT